MKNGKLIGYYSGLVPAQCTVVRQQDISFPIQLKIKTGPDLLGLKGIWQPLKLTSPVKDIRGYCLKAGLCDPSFPCPCRAEPGRPAQPLMVRRGLPACEVTRSCLLTQVSEGKPCGKAQNSPHDKNNKL